MQYVLPSDLQNIHNFTMKFNKDFIRLYVICCQDLTIYCKTHKFGQPIVLINLYRHVATCRSQQCTCTSQRSKETVGINQGSAIFIRKYQCKAKCFPIDRGPFKIWGVPIFVSKSKIHICQNDLINRKMLNILEMSVYRDFLYPSK